jgi:hypothetical protein
MAVYFESGQYLWGTADSTSISSFGTTGTKSYPPGVDGRYGMPGHSSSPIGAFSVSLDNNEDTYSGTGEIVFTSTEFNYGGWYSTSTGRFTPQVAGVYWISTWMMFDNDAAHVNSYYIVAKNGTTTSSTAYNNYYAYTTSTTAVHKQDPGQSIFYLNGSSDYVSVHVGTANLLYMNSISYTRFMGCFVAAV